MSSGDAEELDWEVAVSLSADRTPLAARPGPGWVPSALSCPDCHGVLWEWRDGDLDRYRCRVGHGWSVQSLAQHQAEGVDAALWAVLKDVEEQAEFTRRLREAARDHGHRYDARYWGQAVQAGGADRGRHSPAAGRPRLEPGPTARCCRSWR